jgi:hypothetical protein
MPLFDLQSWVQARQFNWFGVLVVGLTRYIKPFSWQHKAQFASEGGSGFPGGVPLTTQWLPAGRRVVLEQSGR